MKLISDNPLLMLVDLQKAIDDPSWGERNNPQAEENIYQLLNRWRQKQLPVLHVKHMSEEPGSTYFPGTPGNEFKEPTFPMESEEILEKKRNSAFIGTGLHTSLQEKKISELVIVGVITNNSVEATARMAGNLGYRTIVVSDGSFTFNQMDYGGRERSAQEVHDMSLANLDGEYATVAKTAEVVSLVAGINSP